MFAAYDVCRRMMFVPYDVWTLIMFDAYDVCRIMTFVAYWVFRCVAYDVCRLSHCHIFQLVHFGIKLWYLLFFPISQFCTIQALLGILGLCCQYWTNVKIVLETKNSLNKNLYKKHKFLLVKFISPLLRLHTVHTAHSAQPLFTPLGGQTPIPSSWQTPSPSGQPTAPSCCQPQPALAGL